jgi:hypothetical protein
MTITTTAQNSLAALKAHAPMVIGIAAVAGIGIYLLKGRKRRRY